MKVASALLGLVVLVWTNPADAGDNHKGKRSPPLVLEELGGFFVGGVKMQTEYANPPGAFIGGGPDELFVNQMYVEKWEPADKNKDLPAVVFLHGSTHSGVTWEQTPDGREGWAHFFARKGATVYIVDQAGRGRSGYDRSPIIEARVTSDPTIIPNLGGFGHQAGIQAFRVGTSLTDIFRKTRFPVAAKDEYFKQLVPNYPAQSSTTSLTQLLDQIGPAVLIGHSAGGQPVMDAAIQRPNDVLAVVNVEAPGGCNIPDTAIAAAYKRIPLLGLYGDVDYSYEPTEFWKTLWNNAVLSCDSAVTRIKAAGGKATNIYLPRDKRIFGNSHMLMMDNNSDALADMTYRWLIAALKKRNSHAHR